MNFNSVDYMGKTTLLEVVTKQWWNLDLNEQQLALIESMMIASFAHNHAPSMVHTVEVAQLTGNLQQSLVAGLVTTGKIHGAATMPCAKLLQTNNKSAEKIAKEYISKKKRIPGIGHRIYKDDDPRSVLLFDLARENEIFGDNSQKILDIRKEVASIKQHFAINIDGAIAAILSDMNVPWQKVDMVFLWPRLAGLGAVYYENETLKMPDRLR